MKPQNLLTAAMVVITPMTVVSHASAQEHAFLYNNGVVTNLGTFPGRPYTSEYVFAINPCRSSCP